MAKARTSGPQHRRSRLGRELSDGHLPAPAKPSDPDMIDHRGADRGQVDHLADHPTDNFGISEVRPTPTATARLMLDDPAQGPAGPDGHPALRAVCPALVYPPGPRPDAPPASYAARQDQTMAVSMTSWSPEPTGLSARRPDRPTPRSPPAGPRSLQEPRRAVDVARFWPHHRSTNPRALSGGPSHSPRAPHLNG
jgi:hypothetical protein